MSESVRDALGDPRGAAALLLVVDQGEATVAALVHESGSGAQLLGALRVPRGGSVEALSETLLAAASRAELPRRIESGVSELSVAAGRLAEQLGVPIRVAEVGSDASRLVLAGPDRSTLLFEVAAAALIPADPAERRRRCDAVLALLGRSDRSAVADLLGDLADYPLRDRDDERDLIRAAATADALRRLGEAVSEEDASEIDVDGAPLLLVGSAASALATGVLPLAVVAPLLSTGRTRVLLEPYGIFAAFGDSSLEEVHATALLRSLANDLLIPAGDLFVFDGDPDAEATVQIGARQARLAYGSALVLPLRSGESGEAQIALGDLQLRATLHGGISRAAVLFGDPQIDLGGEAQASLSAAVTAAVAAAPIPAPIQLLPVAPQGAGFIGARLLLGDTVEGVVHFCETEPDGAGWEAARAAGLLAITTASPETVLRARAVGVRGVIVLGLSDGEREALAASLERRIAAAVATEPFGLLVMTPRRMSQSGSGWGRQLLHSLHGAHVGFSVEPLGLRAPGRAAEQRTGDVHVIGGAYEGSVGVWEGLADPRADDPLGAVRINGSLHAIPLGDLQRIHA